MDRSLELKPGDCLEVFVMVSGQRVVISRISGPLHVLREGLEKRVHDLEAAVVDVDDRLQELELYGS